MSVPTSTWKRFLKVAKATEDFVIDHFVVILLLVILALIASFGRMESIDYSDLIKEFQETQRTIEQMDLYPPIDKDVNRATVYSEWSQYPESTETELILANEVKNYDKVISCYYNMPNMQNINGELLPLNIDPFLCTHINAAFASIAKGIIILANNKRKVLQQLRTLKEKNSKLKILISIGGSHDYGFANMVINHASRKKFIGSIISFLREYQLDGVDLDWEFPGMSGKPRERQHFSQLLREIRVEFIRGKHDYLLSVAAGAPQLLVEQSYDVDQLNEYTDFVNIMTYDYHYFTKYTPFTGLNSPLYSPETTGFLSTLNINYTVNLYLNKGLSPNKIVVGIPTYGHTFKLVNENNTNIGSPARSFGDIGSNGFVDYPDICQFIEKNNDDVVINLDKIGKVPFLSMKNTWISYEDESSVMEKAKLVKDYNLRGAMIYSLNADDFLGKCLVKGADRFPLASAVGSTLFGNEDAVMEDTHPNVEVILLSKK